MIDADVRRALAEDIGSGDATADLLAADRRASAVLVTREPAILCGSPWFERCFHVLDSTARIDWNVGEGASLTAGMVVCHVSGDARALVTGERTALNFLQTLSATATVAHAYVDATSGTRVTILDTRKTLPGLRLAQKYAVHVGGASNHRIGLFDAILIKENHIAA
ncbi:MAG: nicotinate-nucleotide diphosphorylase, partial [Dokdonella sp.]